MIALTVARNLTKISSVELLEDVFVVKVLENGDGLAQLVVDLALRNALLRFLQQGVTIAGKLKYHHPIICINKVICWSTAHRGDKMIWTKKCSIF